MERELGNLEKDREEHLAHYHQRRDDLDQVRKEKSNYSQNLARLLRIVYIFVLIRVDWKSFMKKHRMKGG